MKLLGWKDKAHTHTHLCHPEGVSNAPATYSNDIAWYMSFLPEGFGALLLFWSFCSYWCRCNWFPDGIKRWKRTSWCQCCFVPIVFVVVSQRELYLTLKHLPWSKTRHIGVCVKTYDAIFGWMNIHLPAILMFTRGTRFWPITTCFWVMRQMWIY